MYVNQCFYKSQFNKHSITEQLAYNESISKSPKSVQHNRCAPQLAHHHNLICSQTTETTLSQQKCSTASSSPQLNMQPNYPKPLCRNRSAPQLAHHHNLIWNQTTETTLSQQKCSTTSSSPQLNMQPNYQNHFKVTEVLQNLLITTNDYTAELMKPV